MPQPLTTDQANAVYDVLVEHVGAVADGNWWRENFVYVQTAEVVSEYRFQGALGFGGKFRRSGWGDRWRVDCYEEDLTNERRQMIDRANEALAELRMATV